MGIEIKTVKRKADLKEFIFLPEIIHKNHVNWLPPIYDDEWKFYNPKYNKQLLQSETVLFLAHKNGILSGRIMGIINKPYNAKQNEAHARFFNFDCFNDTEVSHRLIKSVEHWAREKGMNKVIGPFGFSDKDPQGMQIQGFENLPVIATPANLPYMNVLMEKEGYMKDFDCLVYKLLIPVQIPEMYQRVYNRVIQNKKIKVIEFKSRKELKPWIVPVLRLVNETYKSILGFVPLDEDEMYQLADKYLPILDPDFTKLIVDETNLPIAFIIASPDISVGIKKAKGRIFPIGFIYILLSAGKSKQLDLFLGAVKEEYKGRGLTAILGVKLFQSAWKRGLQYIDSHLILESNREMRSVMERLGAKVYKRYRVYGKIL